MIEALLVAVSVLALMGAARLWVAVADHRLRRRAAARVLSRLAP